MHFNHENAIKQLSDEMRADVRLHYDGDLSDENVRQRIENRVLRGREYAFLPVRDKIRVTDTVFNRIRKDLSILQPFADDPTVSEIMVNGADTVFTERAGEIRREAVSFESTEELEEVIRRIAAKVHREVNELAPILDARLEDGSRVNAVYKNVALNGPILTIRKFPESRITMRELLAYGAITQEAADFLTTLVKAAYNTFISGGTSSGKTTFLNALANFIPKRERVITIEDSAELQIRETENLVRLECRNANAQNKGAVSMRQLIRSSLRMRPDRIIVGEVRGEEVLDMIQAMNTGHDGSLSTGHGNSPEGMLYRLEAMFLQAADFPIDAIRRQITEGIDIMVHLGRLPNARRMVLEIAEIAGMKDGEVTLNKLFVFKQGQGLVPTGNRLIDKTKFMVNIGEGETIGNRTQNQA
ncbi:MAG: Flp pilus assembly complex ATPase component TadA [Clostridiales Family XIII bacterium]|jgi:pilus assembly protein CpaF|nr:Flp pilus assembly complex ATPase component TadA [Clostridiales Family XIII bacterium]